MNTTADGKCCEYFVGPDGYEYRCILPAGHLSYANYYSGHHYVMTDLHVRSPHGLIVHPWEDAL